MTGTSRIRLAAGGDAGELARLRHALYEEPGRAPEPLDEYTARFAPFVRDALASDAWHAWIAEIGGRVVGAMWLQLVERVPRPGEACGAYPIGYLTSVYIEPSHRDEGLGSRMLDGVVAWAREREVEELIVWPSDRSYAFYERAGFTRPADPLVLRLRDEDG